MHPAAAAQTSRLAISSLICGICGFLAGPLTGIPAIVTGHIARRRILKAGGTIQGRGLASAGLILGYTTTILIPSLAAAGFAAANAAIQNARTVTTVSTANAIELAVRGFHIEYATLPAPGVSDTILRTDQDTAFLHVLLGTEAPGPAAINTRSIRFLSAKEGIAGKNGLVYASPDSDRIVGLFDPWGGPYHIALDLDDDGKLSVPSAGGTTITLKGRRTAVWSNGPDRKPGTNDDIANW
jgi:hypothetical protein